MECRQRSGTRFLYSDDFEKNFNDRRQKKHQNEVNFLPASTKTLESN